MAIFGLADSKSTAVKSRKSQSKDLKSNVVKKAKDDNASTPSQEDEAKALLEKMEAKKDADECPFC